jgi:hypothetical protein
VHQRPLPGTNVASAAWYGLPLLLYSSTMHHSAYPPSLLIFVAVMVLMIAYSAGRAYLNKRYNRRNWK